MDEISEDLKPPSAARLLLRRILHVVFFCVLWIPIVLSAIHNIREQTGHGSGAPWTGFGDIISRWGLWLFGLAIWYVLVGAIAGAIFKRL